MSRRSTTVRRNLLSSCLSILLVITLAGCDDAERGELADGGWDAIVAAAKEEGKVVFYNSSTEQQAARLIKAFNEVYPEIKVQTERGGAEMISRVEAQISSGVDGADLYLVGDTEWFKEHADDLLPVTGPGTKGLRSGSWVVDGKAAIVSGSPYSMFVWNTRIFPDGFATYDDVLASNVRGRLAFRGDASKSAAGFLDFLESNFGSDYLRRLGETEPKLYPSVVPATEAVASGEVGLTMAALPPHVFDLVESGAPIDWVYPKPGYAFDYAVAALKNSHRPNAAVVFTDFIMSPAGQQALNGDQHGIASRDNVPGSVDPQGWERLDAQAFPPEVINEWNAKIDEYLK